MPNLPSIPEYITVHLGAPDSQTQNVTVSFPDYIKNVASSEIYPTWPENAIRANIYAQISFALNRIYTEYYRTQGYDFDITNTTIFDQAFVNGRDTFENINRIVDQIFNQYIVREGDVEPLFARYCNGTTSTCDGLSQWGSVELANNGYVPYDILTYYYGDDINIMTNTPVQGVFPSAPPTLLSLGSVGNNTFAVQVRLNRISVNFPDIPKIYNVDGVFGEDTQAAVLAFQRDFDLEEDGVVGPATWYKIQYVYNGVKQLNDLASEGIQIEDISKQYPYTLKEGDSGNQVKAIQYFLAFVAQYETTMNPIKITGYFDADTKAAVTAFQLTYDLPATGVMTEITYSKLFDVYTGIIESLPTYEFENNVRPYPGAALTLGDTGEYVRSLQEYLNYISNTYIYIPKLEVSGNYDVNTRDAVIIFQNTFDIPATGETDSITWIKIGEIYESLKAGEEVNPEQFPGYNIGEGEME